MWNSETGPSCSFLLLKHFLLEVPLSKCHFCLVGGVVILQLWWGGQPATDCSLPYAFAQLPQLLDRVYKTFHLFIRLFGYLFAYLFIC